MKTETFIAAVAAAVSVTITLAACGSSSSGASQNITQDATSTTVPATTVAPRGTAQDSTTTTTTTTASSTTVARPSTLVDELVPVHGARLHVHCEGAGPTTVVLIAGFGGGRDSWAAIEPTLSQTTRVCSFERFGTGTSDAPPTPQSFATEAADLHTLLQSAGEPGPYVIVGHSFGGPERSPSDRSSRPKSAECS